MQRVPGCIFEVSRERLWCRKCVGAGNRQLPIGKPAVGTGRVGAAGQLSPAEQRAEELSEPTRTCPAPELPGAVAGDCPAVHRLDTQVNAGQPRITPWEAGG